MDLYYSSKEVSNSDLSELDKYFNPTHEFYDPEIAYRFGNLFDYMCTEPEKVDYFKRKIQDYPEPFEPEIWKTAELMKKSLNRNEFWQRFKSISCYQQVFRGQVGFEYGKFSFALNMRCKYDFFAYPLTWGGDLKSTAAQTQKQFYDACYHFNYPRSRVLYMLLSGAQKDIIIGVSKKNYKVFTILIVRGDKIWEDGMKQLKDLAFKWWLLYENF